jgi:2,5-diamino-6-hydroxy-4-(5-phosphoribosylamino)pyrimidine 1'-reductase
MNSDHSPYKRPFIILSAASSLDGYISTINSDSKLSNSKDWNRVHKLRAESDAIMVGSGTIRTDDSKLTIDKRYFSKRLEKNPIRIVVSSKCNIPLNSRIITYRPDIPTLIATTSQCSKERKKKLERSGCQVIECGDGPLTDLPQLLHKLKTEFSINNLMLEGGSRLNGEMISQELIDEIHLAIAPVICGEGIPLFTLPTAISKFSESPFFQIITNERIDDMIFLKIKIQYKKRHII